MAITYCQGFGTQNLVDAGVGTMDHEWDTVANVAVISFVAGRVAGQAVRLALTGTAASLRKTVVPASPTRWVTSIWLRFPSALPAANSEVYGILVASGINAMRLRYETDGKMHAQIESSANELILGTAVVGTWHHVDIEVSGLGTTTWTLKATMDGVDYGSVTRTETASTITDVRHGTGGTQTYTVDLDDEIGGDDAGYPLGKHKVVEVAPDHDGTHNISAGGIAKSTGGTTDMWNVVDEWPANTSDYILQAATASTEYAELKFPASTGVPRVVNAFAAFWAATTTTNQGESRWRRSDTTEGSIQVGDMSTAALNFAQDEVTPPGGGWTQAEYDALAIRCGFSTDAAPDPQWSAFMLQYAIPDTVQATLSQTLAALTLSGAATVAVGAALSQALADLTLSGAGQVPVGAALAQTLAAGTLSSTASAGAAAAIADLAQTLAALTLSATAQVPVGAAAAVTLQALALSAATQVPVQVAFSQALAALTAAGTGQVPVTSALAQTLAALTLSGTAQVPVVVVSSQTLGALTLASAAQMPIQATLAQELAPLTLSGSGQVPVGAALAQTLAELTGAGVVQIVVQGVLATSLDAATLASTASIGAQVFADLAATLGALALAGTAQVPVQAAASPTLGALLLSGTGQVPIQANVAQTLGALAGVSTVQVPAQAVLAVPLSDLIGSGAAQVAAQASLAATLGALTVAGGGQVLVVGALDEALAALTLTAFSGAMAPVVATLVVTLEDLRSLSPVTATLAVTLEDLRAFSWQTTYWHVAIGPAPSPPAPPPLETFGDPWRVDT